MYSCVLTARLLQERYFAVKWAMDSEVDLHDLTAAGSYHRCACERSNLSNLLSSTRKDPDLISFAFCLQETVCVHVLRMLKMQF